MASLPRTPHGARAAIRAQVHPAGGLRPRLREEARARAHRHADVEGLAGRRGCPVPGSGRARDLRSAAGGDCAATGGGGRGDAAADQRRVDRARTGCSDGAWGAADHSDRPAAGPGARRLATLRARALVTHCVAAPARGRGPGVRLRRSARCQAPRPLPRVRSRLRSHPDRPRQRSRPPWRPRSQRPHHRRRHRRRNPRSPRPRPPLQRRLPLRPRPPRRSSAARTKT